MADPGVGGAEGRAGRWRTALRSVQSAAIAGVVFAVSATIGIVRLIAGPTIAATDAEIEAYWSAPGAGEGISLTLQLIFIGTAGFLWFVGVIRTRLGENEPKLFSTVFFGGGILFAALLLVGSAAIAVPAVLTDQVGRVPSVDVVLTSRSLGVIVLTDIATRVQALVVFSTSGLGLRTGALPRWLSLVGFVVGLGLLVTFGFREPLIAIAFPVWVALVSVVLFFWTRPAPTV
ncbi:MAG: hypothetical protein AB1Z57_00740 [Acidimicrobiia bacterium]